MLRALAAAGHGSQVLLADGNYPHTTGVSPAATVVHLNLRPGLVGVLDVLETVLTAVLVESAAVMQPGEGPEPEVFADFRALLPGVHLEPLERYAFYRAAREPTVALAVATGEQRWYANLLLTIGAVPGPTA
jgi:L-fucose mutarotase